MGIPAEIIKVTQEFDIEDDGSIVGANFLIFRIGGHTMRALISDSDAQGMVRILVSGQAPQSVMPATGGTPVAPTSPTDYSPEASEELDESIRYQEGSDIGVFGGDPSEPPRVPEDDEQGFAPPPAVPRVAPPLPRQRARSARQVMADEQGNPISHNQGGVSVSDYVAGERGEAAAG